MQRLVEFADKKLRARPSPNDIFVIPYGVAPIPRLTILIFIEDPKLASPDFDKATVAGVECLGWGFLHDCSILCNVGILHILTFSRVLINILFILGVTFVVFVVV